MGIPTIPDREDGLPNGVINATWFNLLKQVLCGLFVGRDSSSGAPVAGQDLGSNIYPWGRVFCGSLVVDGSLLDVSTSASETHKVVSGKKRSTSNQPAFLTPAGAAGGPAFTLHAASVPLTFEVFGVTGEITTDITVSGLSLAPSSTNTCTLNDANAQGQEATRTWGEPDSGVDLTVSSMGASISALVGKYAAFKVVNGGNTEYFVAYVESTTKLRGAYRGYFFNSSLAPINRIKLSNGNTITLMKLHWVFADVDGTTVTTTSTVPSVDATQPSGAATNDYWFDLISKRWKRFDGAAFQTVDRTLVGLVVVDTADCIAARCIDFYAAYANTLDIEVEYASASTAKSKKLGQRANVAGEFITFQTSKAVWDMATDLAGSADLYDATEQSKRAYHFYLKDTGQEVISDISPYYRGDLSGWYHPHNPWRRIGSIQNSFASDFISSSIFSEFKSVADTSAVDALRLITSQRIARSWTVRSSPVDKQFNAIAYSPALKRFCAVATSAATDGVITSANGTDWTGRTSVAANSWTGIAWSPELSLFAAVAASGTNRVMTSPDGITWTARSAASALSWNSICWSSDLAIFVAVALDAAGSTVMTSPDGITWTGRTPGASVTFAYNVTWASEIALFVSVSSSGTNRVMTSPDGITWTARTAAAARAWRSVAWSPTLGLFAAVASDGSGDGIMTSPDGITWTSRTPPIDNAWKSIVWAPELKMFMAVAGAASAQGSMTSYDGITWTSQPGPTVDNVCALAWSPELSIFAAVSQSVATNHTWATT